MLPGWIAAEEPSLEESDDELDLGSELLPAWLDSGDSQGTDSFKKIVLSPGPGVCPAAANVLMRFSAPSYSVSRGNVAGDVYTVTMTNNSLIEIPEVSLLVDPNQGFYYLGATATAASSISGTILITDPGTTAPDAAFSLILNASPRPPEKRLMPGETITFTFRLATNADALSGQQLFANLVSGDTPPAVCQTAVVNVPTVRGNLTVEKSPTTQDGRFGEIMHWNIRLKNTGLGTVYQAVFTDTAGSGYTGLWVDPIPAPVDLAPNASQIYTVSAQINSCTNLTNTVAASWSIGNSDGTATPSNPLSDDVDILFVLDEPEVIVEVAPIPEQDYCGVYSATVPITVTNQGGAARNTYLSGRVEGGLLLDTSDPDWSRSGDNFTYLGGSPQGTLAPGDVITFTLEISSDRLCETRDARVDFTPHFMDACLCLDYIAGTNGASQTLAIDAPTLVLTKTGPAVINAGDVFTYVINVSGNNQQSISAPGVLITDSIPTELIIQQVTASRGVYTQTGSLVDWNLPITTAVGSYNETLFIRVEVPAMGLGECGAGGDITNHSGASARGCPDCWLLQSDAEVTTHVQDFMGADNHFARNVPPIELCASGDEQTIENYLDINDGITWTGTIFTDTLGLGVFGHPLEIVPGSVSVFIDALDRTADVTIMPGPPLLIDFSAIGVYSDTADITITYQVTAAFGTLPFEVGSQTFFQFASFHLGGYPSTSCSGQNVSYFGSYVTLNQGIMDFAVTPGDILGCHENTVRLDVTGPNTVTLTDHLLVTFTADPGDVFTATQYELGGSFIETTVDVVQVGNIATFTFPTNFNFNENGWIVFPLFRPCGVDAPLLADIQYQDRCAAVRTAAGSGGSTTLISNVNLFVTPDQYTVNTKDAVWRFYVGNGSLVAAENVIVTNTLPIGHKFIDAVISSTGAPTDTVSVITGTLPAGQEVVTFTISSLPQYGRLRFDISSRIDDLCVLPAEIGIAMFDECGRVGPGEVCQGRQESKATLLPGPTFLVSSNDQTAQLPLCETGFARLIVKNSSAAAEEFDFHVTNTLTNATLVPGSVSVTVTNELGQIVVGNTSGQLLAGIPFPPVVVTNGNAQILSWSRSDFASGSAAFDVLDVRQASEVIEIFFEVQTGCAGTGAQVQSVGTARDVCQRPLSYTEDAKTLLVNAPELNVIKRGYNASRGYALDDLVYARPGDVVRWQIDVTNVGDQHVLNLFITDTLPINYSYSSSNQGGVFDGTDTVSWALTGNPVLDVGATSTFLITGTILANSCALDTQNDVYAIFACSTGDLCSGLPAEAEATLQSRPSVTSLASSGELTNCGGEITMTITNDGPPAEAVVLTDTLPGGFVYEQLISATTMPDGTPVDGANPAVFRWSGANLLPSGITTLVFRVRNGALAGACSVPPVPITNTLQLEYNDACDSGPYFVLHTDSDSFELDNPLLVVNQNPITQVRDVGDLAVWTLTVQNTGDAPAVNVSIQDHVASNFNSIIASNGSYGTVATILGNEITWTPAITIPVGGMWTAILTATILGNGVNTNILTATATCEGGCQYASVSRAAYVTLLEEFTKTPALQYGTIGELQVYQFSALLPDQDAVYADLVLSDTLPAGLGYLSSAVTYTENADVTPVIHHMDTPTSAPAYAQSGTIRWELGDLDGVVQISGVVSAVIQNVASNVHQTILPNRIRLTYTDDSQPYTFYSTGNTEVLEPLLQVDKSVSPANSKPGELVFYTLHLYHEAGNTQTAYNVVLTDVVPAELEYIPGTLSLYNGPSGTLNDGGAPTLLADFPVVDSTWTAARPIRLTYAAVVRRSVSAGIYITNTANSTWTSLPDDPYGERRDGTGGVNDYHVQDQAQVALQEIRIEKTGPLTITAGEAIHYQVTVMNEGPAAVNAVVTDTMPFQVDAIAATPSQGSCAILPATSGDVIVCDMGLMNPGQATIAIDGLVDPNTPLAADLTNRVLVSSTSPDGETSNNTAEVDTEVFTRADLELSKTGPIAAVAGEIITYTITVSNSGPSKSQDVDVKDLLPEGVTYLSASASQGLCVSGICQLGDLPVGGEVSMVVTALVGSAVTGVITNTAEVFADTGDDNPANNLDTHLTTVSGRTRLEISKVDLTDPVYAGETYFYEIVITNSGPSDAENVVISDTLPVYVQFEGASPECSHDASLFGGRVTCTRDRLAAGESLDFLINVRVNSTVAGGTVGTNSVSASTTTPIDPGSVLRDDETTLYLQKVGNPTDLAITKASAPASGLAGSGQFTYTLTVVNNGPSPAAAVQVVDAYPREFDFFSASTSDGSLCNQGMTCDLGDMAVGETVVITLVVDIPAGAPAGAYVNDAHVGSASPDSNPANNDDDATNTVVELANLEIRKQASPDPAIAGQDLTYLMDVSNTGPSLARNVIVSDTIPLGFQPGTFVTTKGVCTIAAGVFTCNLGDMLPAEQAQVILTGAVLADASAAQIANTVEASSTTPGSGDTATVTPGLAGQVDLWLVKTGTATASPGEIVSYTITIRNQGPSDASNVTLTDQLPAGLTYGSISPSAGCTQTGGLITCDLGTLSAFAQRVFVIQANVDPEVAPGTSLENFAIVAA